MSRMDMIPRGKRMSAEPPRKSWIAKLWLALFIAGMMAFCGIVSMLIVAESQGSSMLWPSLRSLFAALHRFN